MTVLRTIFIKWKPATQTHKAPQPAFSRPDERLGPLRCLSPLTAAPTKPRAALEAHPIPTLHTDLCACCCNYFVPTLLPTYLPCLAGCTAPSPFTRTTHPQPRGDQRTPESSSLPTPCSVHAPPSPQAASALPMQVSPISGLTFIMHEAVEMDSPIRPVGYIHLAHSLAWVPAGRRGP